MNYFFLHDMFVGVNPSQSKKNIAASTDWGCALFPQGTSSFMSHPGRDGNDSIRAANASQRISALRILAACA